jgi:hypothetical protein
MAEKNEFLCGLFALSKNTKATRVYGYPESRLKIIKVKFYENTSIREIQRVY